MLSPFPALVSTFFQGKLDATIAMIIKQRVKAGAIERMDLVGTVEGCDAIIGELFFVKERTFSFSRLLCTKHPFCS